MKILITGFETFGEYKLNPSQRLVQALPDQYAGTTLLKSILPVHHEQAPNRIINLLREHQPDAVITFGLAAGRAKISIERVAINLVDFSLADNAGVRIENQPVIEDGPAAYFSTLPILRMLEVLTQADIPAELSLTAGSYLCNLVFYILMHEIETHNLKTRAGFIHLPALPEQAASSKSSIPSMAMEHIHKAAHLLIAELGQT
jgi:pyroglutamyl-peptidase